MELNGADVALIIGSVSIGTWRRACRGGHRRSGATHQYLAALGTSPGSGCSATSPYCESFPALLPILIAFPLGIRVSRMLSGKTYEYVVLALLLAVGVKLTLGGING